MSFSLDLDNFIKHVGRNADQVVRYVTLAVGNSLVLKSPVGNPSLWITKYPPKGYVGGRFRANWMFGVDSIDESTTEEIDPSGGTSLARADIIPDDAAGHIFYWSNSLPYAQRLEDGWSSQAPSGMVGLTVVEFQDYISRAMATIS